MVKRHPYRAVGAVLAVFTIALFVAGMIGQFNDGPWGGLPEWVGRTSYVVWTSSMLVLLVLSAYLAVANVQHRRSLR